MHFCPMQFGYNILHFYDSKLLQSIFKTNRVFTFLVISAGHRCSRSFHRYWFAKINPLNLPRSGVWHRSPCNLFISLANRKLNKLVIDHPAFLIVDLVFTAGLLAVSGGSQSPYYLYALSPLLAGAFFFQMRGALVVSA
jgi:hypothetical protein